VRSKRCRLLNKLDEFPNAVLVTGCQRSGTSMRARVITLSEGMTYYWFGDNDEAVRPLKTQYTLEYVSLSGADKHFEEAGNTAVES